MCAANLPLDANYIAKIDPKQLQALQEQGLISKNEQGQYVGNPEYLSESCFVKAANTPTPVQKAAPAGAAQSTAPVMGTAVERTAQQQPKGEQVGQAQQTYTVPMSGIMERMGLTDDGLKAKFTEFLQKQGNLSLDKDGNINFDAKNKTALQDALNAFADQNKAHFVNPKAEKHVEFTQDSSPEMIQELGKDAVISDQPDSTGRYTVKDEKKLNETLTEKIGDTKYETSEACPAQVEAMLTTSSTRRENLVNVPDNLRNNKAGRKKLEADARKAYTDMVAKADPEKRSAIDLYIAERKYNSKIEKKMAEMMEYKSNLGGKKEKSIKTDDADIVQLYMDKYLKKDDKKYKEFDNLITTIQNSTSEQDQKAIMDALKSSKVLTTNFTYDELPADLKRKGALIATAKAQGYEPKTLLRLMATSEVMGQRSPEEVANDDKYFIEEQTKDYVKNRQAEQDVNNTTVHFSKKDRKDAGDDGKIHTDIGKKGRALVKACPEMLCDEITDGTIGSEDDGYIKAKDPKTGKTRYFKFNQDKWKTFMGICCDPSTATDAQMKVLFGNNKDKKEAFMKDLNLTLQEGRSILDMSLPSMYGKTGTVKFENIVGNNNGKIGNRELNSLRDMVESAGYSVDKNGTAGKRLLHVLQNAGIGAVAGFATGGLGSLFSGALTIAGTTAPQTVKYSVDKNWSTTVTTTDNYIDKFGTTSITHETPKSGTVHVEGEVTAEEQQYSETANNHLDNAKNAGILGAISGAVTGLATMGKIQERGRNTDDVFALTREVPDEKDDNVSLALQVPQYTTVETRKGEKEIGANIPKLKAVRYRGPEAYHGLYKYEDGTPVSPRDFARAYQKEINGVMTDFNFFVYPELTVPGKGKIIPVKDYEKEYEKIKPGVKGNIRGVVRNPQGKRTVHAQGTIS